MKDWPVEPYEVQKQRGFYPRGICTVCFTNYGLLPDNTMRPHAKCKGGGELTRNLVTAE